jgi:predicted Zn-dependent protease
MKRFLVLFFLFLRVFGAVSAQAGGSGGRDLSDAISRLTAAADEALMEFSPRDEYYLGRAVGGAILSRYRPWLQNPGLTAYVAGVCAALTVNSPRPEIYNGYHVMLLDSWDINAFATSGGHIFICRGLVEAVDSEDTLAALIAHELAHIQLGHSLEILNNTRLMRELSAVAGRAAAVAGREASLQEQLLLFNTSVNEIADSLMINGYSQAQEFDADTYALYLLAGAGYNPSSMIDILRILERSRRPGGLNTTHPSPALRILHVRENLPAYQARDTRSYRRRRFALLFRDFR